MTALGLKTTTNRAYKVCLPLERLLKSEWIARELTLFALTVTSPILIAAHNKEPL